ncbi:hypothetical protein [Bordetella sp. LUAb4]|uniref:hypothetical protein n=1 Tax=Bordetella sp. LUAb4 TaxID=2843195 RepID=UPI001E389751|nr:hypothetical protein [Bordetella sp. LUAb4]
MNDSRSPAPAKVSLPGASGNAAQASVAAATPIYIAVDTDKNQSLIRTQSNEALPTLYVKAFYDQAHTQPVASANIVFSFCPAFYGDPRRGGASTAGVWPLSQTVSVVNGEGSCSGFTTGVCTGDIYRQESDRDQFGTAYIYAHSTDISGAPFTDDDKPRMAVFTVKVAVKPVAAGDKCRLIIAGGDNQFLPLGNKLPLSSPLLAVLINDDDSTIVTGVPIAYNGFYGNKNTEFPNLSQDQVQTDMEWSVAATTRNGFPSSSRPYTTSANQGTAKASVPSMPKVDTLTFVARTASSPPANATALFPSSGNMQSTQPNTQFPHNLTTATLNDSVSPATPLLGIVVTYEITSGNAVFDYTRTVAGGEITQISTTKAQSFSGSSYLVPSPYVSPTSDNGVVSITASTDDAVHFATFILRISASAPIPNSPSSSSDTYYVDVDKGNLQDQLLRTPYEVALTASAWTKDRQPVSGGSITFDVQPDTAIGAFNNTAPSPIVNGIATASSLLPFSIFSSSSTSDYGTFTVRAYPTGVDPATAAPGQVAIYTERTWRGPSAKIFLINDGQTTSPGLAFHTRLQAKVQDSFNAPVESVLLTFTITSGATFDINDKPDLLVDVSPSTARVRTNASGIATAPNIIAGNTTGDVKVQVSTPVAATQTYTLHVQSGTINPGDGDAYRIDVLTGSRLSMSKHGQASPQFALTDTTSGRRMPNTPMQMDVGNTGGASVSFSLTDPTMQSTTVTTNDEGIALVTVYSADATGSATLLASYPGADSKTVIISVS